MAPSRDYIAPLDGLRAVSVLLVMLGHFGLEHVMPGTFGVTVFFFISGFLITRQLLAEQAATGGIALGAFYARRALRLWPALLVMVPVASLAVVVAGGYVTAAQVLGGLFYVTNYLAMLVPYGTGPDGMGIPLVMLWSLAVEEHFYLVFPLLVLAVPRPTRLAAVLLGVIVAVGVWRGWLALGCLGVGPACHDGTVAFHTDFATDTRIDAIAYGALLATVLATRVAPALLRLFARRGVVPVAAALLLLSLLLRDPVFRAGSRYSVQGIALFLGLGAVLFGAGEAWARRALASGPLVVVGRWSYSLYLWHGVVLVLVVAGLPRSLWHPAILDGRPGATWLLLVLPALVALSLGAAALSYHLIERPVAALRRRFGARA